MSARPDGLTLPSDECLREHAYLISRGVRALAVCGNIVMSPSGVERAYSVLRGQSATIAGSLVSPIPFVIESGHGFADCGYAAAPWVIDILRWIYLSEDAKPHVHRIIGLLLGYSPAAMNDFEVRQVGRPDWV